jgi:hypothetical protein
MRALGFHTGSAASMVATVAQTLDQVTNVAEERTCNRRDRPPSVAVIENFKPTYVVLRQDGEEAIVGVA